MAELDKVVTAILHLSSELNELGDKQVALGDDMERLKKELEEWAIDQADSIREKERSGRLKMLSGEEIKLTDPIRESLVRYGKRKKYAEYEGLKRKAARLDQAIRAKTAALTGWQSVASVIKKEMEILQYQPG